MHSDYHSSLLSMHCVFPCQLISCIFTFAAQNGFIKAIANSYDRPLILLTSTDGNHRQTQATKNMNNAHGKQPLAIEKTKRNSWMDYNHSANTFCFLFHGQQTKHLLVIGCRALQTHCSGHHCVIEKTVPKRQE